MPQPSSSPTSGLLHRREDTGRAFRLSKGRVPRRRPKPAVPRLTSAQPRGWSQAQKAQDQGQQSGPRPRHARSARLLSVVVARQALGEAGWGRTRPPPTRSLFREGFWTLSSPPGGACLPAGHLRQGPSPILIQPGLRGAEAGRGGGDICEHATGDPENKHTSVPLGLWVSCSPCLLGSPQAPGAPSSAFTLGRLLIGNADGAGFKSLPRQFQMPLDRPVISHRASVSICKLGVIVSTLQSCSEDSVRRCGGRIEGTGWHMLSVPNDTGCCSPALEPEAPRLLLLLPPRHSVPDSAPCPWPPQQAQDGPTCPGLFCWLVPAHFPAPELRPSLGVRG